MEQEGVGEEAEGEYDQILYYQITNCFKINFKKE